MRPGRTTMDIYRLFDREELQTLSLEEIRKKTDEALIYDAYRDQEELRAKYLGSRDLRGLENVLYQCPECGREFSVAATRQGEIYCTGCDFRQVVDAYGFFRNEDGTGGKIPYVSQWSRWIHRQLAQNMEAGENMSLSAKTQICMVDDHKFLPVGEGVLTLQPEGFRLEGTLQGEQICKEISIAGLPILPFSPGKHLELQDGGRIYRCVLEDGRLVMKYIHMLKIFYEASQSKNIVKA